MRQQVARKESYDVQSGVRKDFGANTRFSVSKCRFTHDTASLALRCGSVRTVHPIPESSMSRRQLSFLILAIASFALTACGSSPTAPKNDSPAIIVVGGVG